MKEKTTIGILLFTTLLSLPAAAADGIISYLEGEVYVTRNGAESEGDFGFEISRGDRLRTGPDGLAVIELTGRGTLKITENTSLVLTSVGSDTRLDLEGGSLFAKARKLAGGDSFTVRTDAVVAGIRGTEFFMAYGRKVEETPDVWLCVREGTVEVGVDGRTDSVLVEEGEGISILGGREWTDPRYYAWTEDLNWNTEPGGGSLKNEADLSGAYADLLDQDYF